MKPFFVILFLVLVSVPARAEPCNDFSLDFGADPTGVIDSAPSWNLAQASGIGCLHLSKGQYLFESRTDAIAVNKITGDGIGATWILCDLPPGTACLKYNGLMPGWILEDLHVLAVAGSFGVNAIDITTPPHGSNDGFKIRGVHISGWGTWNWCIVASASPFKSPFGLRVVTVDTVLCQAATKGAFFKNFSGLYLTNFWLDAGCPAGAVCSDDLWLRGADSTWVYAAGLRSGRVRGLWDGVSNCRGDLAGLC